MYLATKNDIPAFSKAPPKLHSLCMHQCVGVPSYAPLLFLDLPTNIRTADVAVGGFYGWRQNGSLGSWSPLMARVAKTLTTASFIDGPSPISSGPYGPQRRGGLDSFVAELAVVTRLTLTTLAVLDLASLAALWKLKRLEIVGCVWSPTPPVRSNELVTLLTDSKSLTHVRLASEIQQAWFNSDKTNVSNAAAASNVGLTWL